MTTIKNHEQLGLPEQRVLPDTASSNVPDFELRAHNVLKTAKDQSIKDKHIVNDVETAMLHGQKFSNRSFSTLVTGAVHTISATDYLVGVTSLSYAPLIGLPLPSLVGAGKSFIIKDEAGGAATTTITISSAGEKNIDGSSTTTITTNYGAKRLYSDGSQWLSW